MLPRLATIPLSHFCERARWALDQAGIEYAETHHLQGFSSAVARVLSGRRTLPVLTVGAQVLGDSGEILRWAGEQRPGSLYPDDPAARAEIERLEASFTGTLAIESRRIVYDWMCRSIEVWLPFNAGRAPTWQSAALWAVRASIPGALTRGFQLRSVSLSRARLALRDVFDTVAARLASGRRFLVGDAFSAADLTFASLSAPLLLPERYGAPIPRLADLPPSVGEQARLWRSHPAGQFAMAMYEMRPPIRARFERDRRGMRLLSGGLSRCLGPVYVRGLSRCLGPVYGALRSGRVCSNAASGGR
jgi:glutathione S-transferase